MADRSKQPKYLMINKIKICFISAGLDRNSYSNLIYNYSKYLDHQQFEITVISFINDFSQKEEFERLGIRLKHFDLGFKDVFENNFRRHPWQGLRLLLLMTRFFKKEKFQIILIIGLPQLFFGLLASYLARVPVRIGRLGHRRETATCAFWGIAKLTKLASHWIEGDKEVLNQLAFMGVTKNKLIHLLPFIDSEIFHPFNVKDRILARKNLNLPLKSFVVTYIGRLIELKGVDEFLKMAKEVLDQVPEAEFVIAGEGMEKKKLKELSKRLGIAKKVHFLGFSDKPWEVYAASDVVILISRPGHDSIPLTALEAMACGLPVLSYPNPSFERVLHPHRQFFIESADSKVLAKNIIKLKDPSVRQSLARISYQVFQKHFSPQKHIPQLNFIFRNLYWESLAKKTVFFRLGKFLFLLGIWILEKPPLGRWITGYMRKIRQQEPKILLYHGIGQPPAGEMPGISVSENLFTEQIAYLAKNDRVIPMEGLLAELPQPKNPAPVAITFDDGYKDALINAQPILKRYHFPATVFIIGKTLQGSFLPSWTSRTFLNEKEIIQLNQAGWGIGCHGFFHLNLVVANEPKAGQEIRQTVRQLKKQLQMPIRFFAYPYGSWDNKIKEIVRRAGFQAAFAVDQGSFEDNFALPRLSVFEGCSKGLDGEFSPLLFELFLLGRIK